MSNNLNYKKYLKYKNKYIILKNQLGSSHPALPLYHDIHNTHEETCFICNIDSSEILFNYPCINYHESVLVHPTCFNIYIRTSKKCAFCNEPNIHSIERIQEVLGPIPNLREILRPTPVRPPIRPNPDRPPIRPNPDRPQVRPIPTVAQIRQLQLQQLFNPPTVIRDSHSEGTRLRITAKNKFTRLLEALVNITNRSILEIVQMRLDLIKDFIRIAEQKLVNYRSNPTDEEQLIAINIDIEVLNQLKTIEEIRVRNV